MVKANLPAGTTTDELLSELATAAYRVASQNQFKGAFIDIELDLWYAHRARPRWSNPGSMSVPDKSTPPIS